MNTSTLDRVLQEMAPRIGRCCIAGGAVRDVLIGGTPKDYDVFAFEPALDRRRLKGLPLQDRGSHKYEPRLFGTYEWEGLTIQVVMAGGAETIPELLDGFDWNVSRFAYDGSVHAPGQLPKRDGTLALHRVTYPVSTLRRGMRFADRYGMRLHDSDLKDLCALVLLQASGGRLVHQPQETSNAD